MTTFHEDSVQFMIDLLKLLNKNAQTISVGQSSSGKESVYSVLSRLLGLTIDAQINVDDNPNNEVQEKNDSAKNLIDGFFKVQTQANKTNLQDINKLLILYKKRLIRYSKARQKIKLNRTKKLIDQPENPLVAEDLVENNPEQTRRTLSKKQSEIAEQRDLKGIVHQDLAIQQALELSLNKSVSIPEDLGEFRNQLYWFLRQPAKEASNNIEKLKSFEKEITSEINKLERAEQLLFDGVSTFSGEDQKLSLTKILDVLIFLTDRKRMKYECSQCKFFLKGKENACIYAGEGTGQLTPLVSITDEETGKQITGRQTKTINSCDQVWGLKNNEYFRPSDSVVEFAKKILKE